VGTGGACSATPRSDGRYGVTRPALTVVHDEPARLRVITAGDVGNVQSRLGSSGFDVVAVVDNEADLLVAVGSRDPDAIVVEADLCPSLEHVHELAPDAALIVVGDHTPAGALGHIDRGVSGTVLAGLLQALAAGGVSAAIAVPGFVSIPPAPRTMHLTHGVQQVAAAGVATLVVAGAVAAVILGGRSPAPERPVDAPAAPVIAAPPPLPQPPGILPAELSTPRERAALEPASRPVADAPEVVDEGREPPPSHPSHTAPPPSDRPSPHPPGHAKGWEHRPPKQEDHGHHHGWTNGHGPKP
jgi:hypothetical protein